MRSQARPERWNNHSKKRTSNVPLYHLFYLHYLHRNRRFFLQYFSSMIFRLQVTSSIKWRNSKPNAIWSVNRSQKESHIWKGRQYPKVFQHFMFLRCLWVLMSGSESFSRVLLYSDAGCDAYLQNHIQITGLQWELRFHPNTPGFQLPISSETTVFFLGIFWPPRDCGNAITYVAQSQGTDFVDHPRWITIDFYYDPVGVRGEFQPLGSCQKGKQQKGSEQQNTVQRYRSRNHGFPLPCSFLKG